MAPFAEALLRRLRGIMLYPAKEHSLRLLFPSKCCVRPPPPSKNSIPITSQYIDTWRQDPMDSSMYIRLLIGRYIPEALADAVLVFVLNEL